MAEGEHRTNPALLELCGVGKTYGGGRRAPVTVVRDANLAVLRGECVVITGRSGAGKTTLLNLAAGLARPSTGQVLYEGAGLWQLPDAERTRLRGRKIGFVFQFPSLLPTLTVLENVLLPGLFAVRTTASDVRPRALDLLERVGLAHRMAAYASELSAGEQQRAVIARALVNRPELLLADEPTSNLDERTEQEILSLLRGMQVSEGLTLVMATHAALVAAHARVLEMAAGRLGPPLRP